MKRKPNRTNEPLQGDTIAAVLKAAERTPGWNARTREVRRFDLGDCVLIVVPARRWIYRRHERQTDAWAASQAAQERAS